MPLETLDEANIRNLVLTVPERKTGFDLDKELDEKTIEDFFYYANMYRLDGEGMETVGWTSVLFANSRRSEQLLTRLRSYVSKEQLIYDYDSPRGDPTILRRPLSRLILKILYNDDFKLQPYDSFQFVSAPSGDGPYTILKLLGSLLYGDDGRRLNKWQTIENLNRTLSDLSQSQKSIDRRVSLMACATLRILTGEMPHQATKETMQKWEEVYMKDRDGMNRGYESAQELVGLTILKCKDVIITPERVEFVWQETRRTQTDDVPLPTPLKF